MNIIFLDIDGVLNSMPYFEELKKSGDVDNNKFHEISKFHLSMLSIIYHECNAKIVLASTWRDLYDGPSKDAYKMYQYLVDSLAKYDMYIFDKTPVINFDRPLEIHTWLNNHTEIEIDNFVILDDDYPEKEYKKYGLEEHLISTVYFCSTISEGGLQQRHVDNAIKIMKGV